MPTNRKMGQIERQAFLVTSRECIFVETLPDRMYRLVKEESWERGKARIDRDVCATSALPMGVIRPP